MISIKNALRGSITNSDGMRPSTDRVEGSLPEKAVISVSIASQDEKAAIAKTVMPAIIREAFLDGRRIRKLVTHRIISK